MDNLFGGGIDKNLLPVIAAIKALIEGINKPGQQDLTQPPGLGTTIAASQPTPQPALVKPQKQETEKIQKPQATVPTQTEIQKQTQQQSAPTTQPAQPQANMSGLGPLFLLALLLQASGMGGLGQQPQAASNLGGAISKVV